MTFAARCMPLEKAERMLMIICSEPKRLEGKQARFSVNNAQQFNGRERETATLKECQKQPLMEYSQTVS